jgi:hypothetical protein
VLIPKLNLNYKLQKYLFFEKMCIMVKWRTFSGTRNLYFLQLLGFLTGYLLLSNKDLSKFINFYISSIVVSAFLLIVLYFFVIPRYGRKIIWSERGPSYFNILTKSKIGKIWWYCTNLLISLALGLAICYLLSGIP